ncbi:MAG: glycerate kinase [Muribaculaceae bacterium]|nr:glycerate kinase [Muribaculaceae bacterium]
MRKIVIASDSFKGSLNSADVASCCERGIKRVLPHCQVEKVNIADGGEGTLAALLHPRCTTHHCLVRNPLRKEIEAEYATYKSTAYIELSSTSGLTLVPSTDRNPWITDTYGLGEIIADALDKGCRQFIIGIGGSATNDAGIGMLSALGYRFLDNCGATVSPGGKGLIDIVSVDNSNIHPKLTEAHFTVACDVQNPLYGPNGAAYIFAPQKGADAAMTERLDLGLRNFAAITQEFTGCNVSGINGAGAAGGVGAAFVAYLGAELKSGIDVILDIADFNTLIADADLIITGEGCIDSQTLMGKAAYGVLRRAKTAGVPVVALGGIIRDRELLTDAGFDGLYCINDPATSIEEAMKPDIAKRNIERTAELIAKLY